jgi:membrane protein implicated in regulation of membrane protease activity
MVGWILRTLAIGTLFLAIAGAQSLLHAGVPWWGSLAAAAAIYFVAAFAAKRLFFRAVTAPFKAKGAVLRGAKLVVHSVEVVPAAQRRPALALVGGSDRTEDDDETDERDGCDDTPEGWTTYRVDATVTPPTIAEGPFAWWEPGDLSLVPVDADVSPSAPTTSEECSIRQVDVFEGGEYVQDEGMKYQGEKRLRLVVACAPGVRVAKLRYYFEGFGRIELPA